MSNKRQNCCVAVEVQECRSGFCFSTRFMVHERVYDDFVEHHRCCQSSSSGTASAKRPKWDTSCLRPKVEAMDALVSGRRWRGARIRTGGRRLRNDGFFFQPTVLTDASGLAHYERVPFGLLANRVVLDIRGCHGRSNPALAAPLLHMRIRSQRRRSARLAPIVESEWCRQPPRPLPYRRLLRRNQGPGYGSGRW